MNRILEIISANLITIGFIIAIGSITTFEVNNKYFFNGLVQKQYKLKIF